MQKKPTILNQQIVASSNLFKVEQLQLRFNNGTQRTYERLASSRGAGAVMIVALLDNEHFIVIEEYAAGVDDYQLSIPKGLIEKNEDILAAANRELKEEAGYGARKLEYITSLSLSPNYMTQSIHVVLADDLYPEKLPGDEPETISVSSGSLANLLELSLNPKFSEGRAIAALYIVRDILVNRGVFSLC